MLRDCMKIIALFIYFNVLSYMTYAVAYETISEGVAYKHILEKKQSTHVLLVNPHLASIIIGTANDKCASAEKTTSMAKRYNAIAAINGGFFNFCCRTKIQDALIKILDWLGYNRYQAFPKHTLKRDGSYYSVFHTFVDVIGWSNNDQMPIFGTIKTNVNLVVNGHAYEVTALNRPHQKKSTLYSDCYDNKTPFFSKRCDEIVIENNRVKEVRKYSQGKTDIPKQGWIYAVPKEYKNLISTIQAGDQASVTFEHQPLNSASADDISTEDFCSKEYMLASTPLLIFNGQIPPTLKDHISPFYKKKHPRSAIGLLKDGTWVFVVADGRRRQSEGLTLIELAEFMQSLDCTYALNLDGGGSSTMVINNKVINSPSGREYSLSRKERPISNALLIIPK